MLLLPSTLTRKSYVLFQCLSPTNNFIHPIRVNNNLPRYGTSTSNCSSSSSKLFVHGGNGFGVFGNSSVMGSRSFRVSSGGGGSSGSGTGGRIGGSGGGDGSSSGGGSSWSFLSWYLSHLAKYPVMTKAITSGLLTLIGDLVCQLVLDKVPSLDWRRTFNFTLMGLVLVGPALHTWYLYMSKLVTATGSSSAIIRLVLDQFLFAPVFIGIQLSSLVTLEGKPSYIIPKLRQEWFSTLLANWKLWVPFQFFNFRFVPQPFQVLASNCVSLIWNVILSQKAHREVIAE